MESHEQIWNLAKWRFLQEEASLWLFSNKVLEIALFFGVATWIYFDFFSFDYYTYLKYIGLIIIIHSVGEIRSRFGLYEGYFDGYERGFEDAATRNCDYWGDKHNEFTDNSAINAVLDEIQKNEEKIKKENIVSRENEVKEGFSQLMGYIFTWHKIK
jgi:hypothetical protein